MELKAGIGFHNRFDIEVRDKDTGEVKIKGQAENIVLDRAYTRLCNYSTYFVNICFGQGTGTLDPTRTTLFSSLGYKAASTEETIKAFPVSKWTRKITLNPEEYVGATITEVGISDTTNAINTHALITDAEGNPLSITKTDIDVVVIYATVFIEFKNKSANTIFYDFPTGNYLLNYLCGSSMTNPDIILGASFSNYPLGNTTKPLTTLTPTKTVDTANKKVKYTVRAGITHANADSRIQTIALTKFFKAALPDDDIWYDYEFTNRQLGVGDGLNDTFTFPHTDVFDVVVKIDGVAVPTEMYQLENIEYREGAPQVPLVEYMVDKLAPMDAYTYSGPCVGQTYSVGTGSGNPPPARVAEFHVDGEALVNKAIGFRKAGESNVYGTARANITVYGSMDGVSYTSLGTDSNSSTVESYFMINDVYNYIRVAMKKDGYHPNNAWFYWVYILPLKSPQVVFLEPPAEGAVVTIDYKVPYIPKSEDYVLDITMEVIFGEGV
jgi:hypothetical protein